MENTLNQAAVSTCRRWSVVLSASLFFFYVFIQLNLFNAINADLMRAFSIEAPAVGQLASMFFYANALFLFPAGMMLDRFSTKKILLVATILTIVGTFIFAWANEYAIAAAGRFLVGVGASFCFLSCIKLASRWFPPSKMAFVTGIVVTMAMLGGLVAQTPFALLAQWVGWRQAIFYDGFLGVAIFIAIAWVVEDRPPNSHKEQQADAEHLKQLGLWRCLLSVVGNRYNWFGGIYTSLLNLPVFLLGALWGIHYLVQVHHLPAVQASYATTVFFLGVIFGSPFFGWLSDYTGRRKLPMIVGAIASLIVILVLLYDPNLSLLSLMTLFFLIGFVTSSQVISYPLIAELNPIALTSTAISIASVTVMTSGAIFQPLFGWVMQWHWDQTMVDNIPVYSADNFYHAMLIMPIAFVVGLIIALLIKETYCRSQV